MIVLSFCRSVIHRERYNSLKWRFSTTHYCQNVRPANKVKRYEFAKANLDLLRNSKDLIFADECTVKLEQHKKKCAHRVDEPSKRKPVVKHPLSVSIHSKLSYK